MNCLMIETRGRKFFTHEKNYNQLIEFSKTFDAQMSVVELVEGEVMELAELAPAICNPSYKATVKFYPIEMKKKTRNGILKTAEEIRNHIADRLTMGETVSLSQLKKTFAKYNLTSACLCNHIRKTLETLEKLGFEWIKVGGGKYKLK